MSRDAVRYPNPEEFTPERFLDGEGKLIDDDPGEFIFGFGRRRCPGMPFLAVLNTTHNIPRSLCRRCISLERHFDDAGHP